MNEIQQCVDLTNLQGKESENDEDNDNEEDEDEDEDGEDDDDEFIFTDSDISDILASLVIKIIGIEERLEEETHRIYLVYKFYIYSPFSSWMFFKRYNDFIAFHKLVQQQLSSYPEYSSFSNFQFPEKHWYWTRDTVIQMRTKSFQNYVERAVKIPCLSQLVSHFIGLDEHYEEFQPLQNTTTLISSPRHRIAMYDSENENDNENTNESSHHSNLDSISTHSNSTNTNTNTNTTSSNKKFIEFESTFNSQNLKQSSPAPNLSYNLFRDLQLQQMSELLDNMTGSCLFNSLPPVAQSERYQLAYATYRDGWNMKTLYHKIGTKYPLILLIRLLGYRGLVGAYLSCALGPPTFEFKGNNECFIFKLFNDRIEKYPTYLAMQAKLQSHQHQHHHHQQHTNQQHQEQSEEGKKKNDLEEEDKKNNEVSLMTDSNHLRITKETQQEQIQHEQTTINFDDFNSTLYEYFYSNTDVILFGGSIVYGTNAIRLSNDLSLFSSGPSDTYSNLSLITHSHDIEQMTVSDLEIFTAIGCL